MMNILFVCTGNTCRSPMAEGYMACNYKNHNVKSCGLQDGVYPVSQNSKKAMAEIGIDISSHHSKPITADLIDWADKIICMSKTHKLFLEDNGVDKVQVLGNGIADPFGCDMNAYRRCRDQIIKEIDSLFNDFSILPIEYRHIKEIAKLEKVCFSCPWSEKIIEESFKSGTKFFVAVKNNIVVGYVGLSAILDEGYITNIAVYPEFRNQGIATALLKYLFEFANENKLSFISLEVRESNSNAILLYQKLGFITEGKRKNFYTIPTEDAIIMTKRFD